ncbi:Protein DA1-related 1 [Senna tora]|uniref:Protein DA1-related 1 n=1 Tax=Senna tora TaxID=362788 RepID=A0A834T527_9FABA|nr:Protein DA1-related 1 [Senna tora]
MQLKNLPWPISALQPAQILQADFPRPRFNMYFPVERDVDTVETENWCHLEEENPCLNFLELPLQVVHLPQAELLQDVHLCPVEC